MANYQPGNLVWAKMKGFPPWPATILQPATQLSDVPTNRYSVMFFGTQETAIMKNSDLFDYLENRAQFEVTRKHKGFAEAVKEIQQAAGLDDKRKDVFGWPARRSPSPPSSILHSNRVSGRQRRTSSKLSIDDFFLEPFERKRSASRSSRRSRTNSASSQKSKMKSPKVERRTSGRTPERKRSETKRNSISLLDGLEALDPGADISPMLCDGALTTLLDGLEQETEEDAHTRSGRKINKQKVFEEFISSVRSPSRERSSSTSSSCRLRLFSGMSDAFDEIIESTHFNPQDLLAAIDNLPSEEERPATPEEPLPMPAPSKRCSYCGCECELIGLKWRCTGKSCLKWNGTHDPYAAGEDNSLMIGGGTTSSQSLEDLINIQQQPSTSVSVDFDSNMPTARCNSSISSPKGRGVFAQIKEETEMATLSVATRPERTLSGSERSSATNNWASLDICMPTPTSLFVQPPHIAATSASTLPQRQQTSTGGMLTNIKQQHHHQQHQHHQQQQPSGSGYARPIPMYQKAAQISASIVKPILPRRQLGTGRPKSYKVEKTPPVSENGQRHCAFCGGQVRPQMCGGNKHRWRCVDKKCRKWYGWVRSNEEIPKDLGKKGRWKDLALKIKPKSDSPDGAHCSSSSMGVPHSQNAYITAALPLCEKAPKKVGRPPKGQGKLKLKNKRKMDTTSETDTKPDGDRPKRKYTKRESRPKEDVSRQSSCSPLPPDVLNWQPSAMEQRGRWWTSEKRRQETSPEREWSAQVLDVAASMRLIGHAMNAAANTRADEPGTISGTLDLLMDALMGSLGPMLSLTAQVPGINIEPETIQKLFHASAIHTPLFPS